MSVLIYIETEEGIIKKSSLEAAGYAGELARLQGTHAVAIVFENTAVEVLEKLGNYGIQKVYQVSDTKYTQAAAMPYSSAIAELVQKENIEVIALPKSSTADAMVSRIATKLKAGVATNVLELPNLTSGFQVKRAIYTGKAFAQIQLTAAIKVISIAKNAYTATTTSDKATIESFVPTMNEVDFKIVSKEIQKATGDILLTEADIVVSGGRGMKGPENWGILLDLAKAMHAGTGCSKPVSDMDWRPHHEHVGQTGVKVSPNLYIAIGISGAIQHLAGVNSSKIIVAINKDPEAPFFKAADYGICGDLFDIVPKLAAAAKNYIN
jgi:electron transfer flavoprotein alpha subunit